MILIDEILISDDIVQKRFLCHLNSCKGACCWEGDFGAPLEEDEMRWIEDNLAIVKSYMQDEYKSSLDDMPPFQYYREMDKYGTKLRNDGACVFMNMNDGISSCAFESAYEDGATDFKKPISCHLYPIRVEKNENSSFIALNYDEWEICSHACSFGKENNMPIYSFVKQALIRKFGEEFYERLDFIAKQKTN